VVVGAGISGLSAAYFYRQEHPDARILILDNHDDFGGHAKRNEFQINGETRIGYDGTETIDTPSSYADISRQLLTDIGIDTQRFYDYYDQDLYQSMNLSYAIAYDSETYGKRKLVTGYGSIPWQEFAAQTPMSEKAKADLVRAFTAEVDYLPGMTREEKQQLLNKISYRSYLKDYVKVDEQVLQMYQRWGMSYWCVGMDEVPAAYISGSTVRSSMPPTRQMPKPLTSPTCGTANPIQCGRKSASWPAITVPFPISAPSFPSSKKRGWRTTSRFH
jgi:spermidine dehydrogenase